MFQPEYRVHAHCEETWCVSWNERCRRIMVCCSHNRWCRVIIAVVSNQRRLRIILGEANGTLGDWWVRVDWHQAVYYAIPKWGQDTATRNDLITPHLLHKFDWWGVVLSVMCCHYCKAYWWQQRMRMWSDISTFDKSLFLRSSEGHVKTVRRWGWWGQTKNSCAYPTTQCGVRWQVQLKKGQNSDLPVRLLAHCH